MMAGLLLGSAVGLVVGMTVVALLWPVPERSSPALLVLRLGLGIGVGQGVTACLLFAYLVIHGAADRTYVLCELLIMQILVGLYARGRRRSVAPPTQLGPVSDGMGVRSAGLLAAAFGVAVIAAAVAIGIGLDRVPYGDWDAWAIYNLRARAIFRGGYEWRDGFSGLIPWSHPDYPPLLSLSVVRAWLYAGGESIDAPRLIAALFAASTVAVVTSAIAALRGRTQAYIAGVVLLGNAFMIRHASSQYADVPLAFFLAAAVALVVLHDELARGEGAGALTLTGLAAGLAAWTKNEGTLFVVVLLVAHLAVVARRSGLRAYARQLLALVVGALPILAILAYFKSTLAPPGDLVTLAAGQSLFAKLIDPGRYSTIAHELLQRAPLYDGFRIGIVYLLAIYGFCVGIRARRGPGVAQATLMLLLLCAGYLAVYLITPYDLAWHLSRSIDRLLMQLWPAFVLVFFVLVRTPEDQASTVTPRQKAT